MQVEVSDPSPWSTFPPELKSKVVGFAWLMLVEDLGQNSHPTPPNSTSSARAAYWLLRTFALVSKSWHAATLPFAVRHAFTSQKSLPALLEVVQKYGLENAVRAVRIQPDAPSYPTTRSLAEAYAPWVPLLCACPLIQEISFDSFTTSRPDNHLGGGFAVPAFGQWPMLPFVRRLRINHSSDHHLSLSDLEELSRLTPNLVDLALDPDLFTGAADAAAFELYWPNLQSLAFELAINYNQHGRNPLYLRLIKSIAPTLVVFRLHTPPTRPDNPPFAIPDFLTGGTFFPLVTTFSHPYPLALPRELPQPLFPALTHLTVAFFESAPTPAILTLFTTNLVELAIAIPTLEGWLPILCSTCTTARSLRLLELETLDSFARQGNPPFPLFALRNLAQLCAKEQVVFATSDTRVWAKSKGRLGWEEQRYRDEVDSWGEDDDFDSDEEGRPGRQPPRVHAHAYESDSDNGSSSGIEEDSSEYDSEKDAAEDVGRYEAQQARRAKQEARRKEIAHDASEETSSKEYFEAIRRYFVQRGVRQSERPGRLEAFLKKCQLMIESEIDDESGEDD